MKWFLLSTTALIVLNTVLVGCGPQGEVGEDRADFEQGFTPTQVTLREYGELFELVDDQLVFVDAKGSQWTAPKGALTDGASVPRFLLWVPDGRYNSNFLKAAIIHDAYCQTDNKTRCPDQYRKKPWREVHRMFYDACIAGGTPELLAKTMYAAVWVGGPRWNEREHQTKRLSEEQAKLAFERCKWWIEQREPTFQELEVWMEDLEQEMLEGER